MLIVFEVVIGTKFRIHDGTLPKETCANIQFSRAVWDMFVIILTNCEPDGALEGRGGKFSVCALHMGVLIRINKSVKMRRLGFTDFRKTY